MKIFIVQCTCCQNNLEVDLVKGTTTLLPTPNRPEAETPMLKHKRIEKLPTVHTDRFLQIINLVCEWDRLTIEQIKSKSRQREYVLARQKIFWLARKFTKTSLKKMAEYLGGRDHTTAIHGITAIGNEMQYDDLLRSDMAKLCEIIYRERSDRSILAEALYQ